MKQTDPKIRRIFFVSLLAVVGVTIATVLVLVLRLPDQFRGLKAGDRLPDVRLVSPEGELVDTRSWRGRPTLLALVDPSCPACVHELDNIDALGPAMPHVRIALLSTDTSDAGGAWFPAYRDPSGQLTRRARRFAVPALYWIGSDGRVEYARSGARSLSEDAAIFNALLESKGTQEVHSRPAWQQQRRATP